MYHYAHQFLESKLRKMGLSNTVWQDLPRRSKWTFEDVRAMSEVCVMDIWYYDVAEAGFML